MGTCYIYIVKASNGKTYRLNRRHLRKAYQQEDYDLSDDDDIPEIDVPDNTISVEDPNPIVAAPANTNRG